MREKSIQFDPHNPDTWNQEVVEKVREEFSTINMMKPVYTYIVPHQDGTIETGGVSDTPVKYDWHDQKQVYFMPKETKQEIKSAPATRKNAESMASALFGVLRTKFLKK